MYAALFCVLRGITFAKRFLGILVDKSIFCHAPLRFKTCGFSTTPNRALSNYWGTRGVIYTISKASAFPVYFIRKKCPAGMGIRP
jgi:hypothetical protein